MKDFDAVQAEIAALEKIKPSVRQYSAFGDDHHAAIDAQIIALEEGLSEDDIYDRNDAATEDEHFYADNERDAAIEAVRWRDDPDYDDVSPSESWGELVN